jgi:hypothetical protein
MPSERDAPPIYHPNTMRISMLSEYDAHNHHRPTAMRTNPIHCPHTMRSLRRPNVMHSMPSARDAQPPLSDCDIQPLLSKRDAPVLFTPPAWPRCSTTKAVNDRTKTKTKTPQPHCINGTVRGGGLCPPPSTFRGKTGEASPTGAPASRRQRPLHMLWPRGPPQTSPWLDQPLTGHPAQLLCIFYIHSYFPFTHEILCVQGGVTEGIPSHVHLVSRDPYIMFIL